MGKYQIFYPGQYTEREKPYLEEYLQKIHELEARGPIDVKAMIEGRLPEGTPGVSNKLVCAEDMMLYNAKKYDPNNKLYTDDEYAKDMGYAGKLAMPCYGAHDDSFLTAFPGASRDFLCVCGLNHAVEQLAPVYVGDTLYMVKDSIRLRDVTPAEGSEYRNFIIVCRGTVYNQRGETVLKVKFSARENLKSWADPADRDPNARAWESPDWWQRPAHVYTDADWDFIFNIWKNEKARGAQPLYWEDVQIGDMPTPTLEGPIEQSCMPTPPYGMAVGGSRTMRELAAPAVRATMRRDEKTGEYFPEDKTELIPTVPPYDDPRKKMGPPPPGAGPKPEPKREVFINFLGRDFAIHHINNWMGNHGWLKSIRWAIMSDVEDFGYHFPDNPEAEKFLQRIPAMKGKKINAHGLQGDVMFIKSQVIDKMIIDGEYLVELGFWIETIDGYVYEEGAATVKLPSKNA